MLLALLLAQAMNPLGNPEGPIYSQPSLVGVPPLLDFGPASGAGMPSPCSTTRPTGSKGEALTATRASSAPCIRGVNGVRSTAIADGDIDTMLTDVPRVMLSAGGVAGVMREDAATNLLLRFIAIGNAAWSDVGTPALTGSQASAFTGTYATSAVQVNDDDPAAREGRTQTITVSSGAAHTMFCLVKGGSLLEAGISLDGTTANITGLSITTWSVLQVTDASSSGTSIAAQLLNGDAVGDTGTVIWGGCQVETGSFRTTIIGTDGATATRATEGVPTFAVTIPSGSSVCAVASITTSYVPTTGTTLVIPHASGNPEIVGRFSGGNFGCYMMTAGGDLAAGTWTTGDNRWECTTARSVYFNGTTTTGSSITFTGITTTVGIGSTGGFGSSVNGIYSQLRINLSSTGCPL